MLKFGIDSPYILYLGALDPRKGIDILLSAFDKIKEKGVKLVIAGSTASTPFFDVSDKLNLCSRKNDIIFTGYVSEIEKIVCSVVQRYLSFLRYMKDLDCQY